jgi:hypothetical protein
MSSYSSPPFPFAQESTQVQSGVSEYPSGIIANPDNFTYQTIIIPASKLPLSWLYVRYPILQILFPHSVLNIKSMLRSMINNNDLLIQGYISKLNYIDQSSSEKNILQAVIHGDFTVTTSDNSDIIKGTAIYDTELTDNYLDGDYTAVVGGNKGLLGRFDAGEANGEFLLVDSKYSDITLSQYENGYIISATTYGMQDANLVSSMLGDMSNAWRLTDRIDEFKIASGIIFKYTGKDKFIKEQYIGDTKIITYQEPYVEYSQGCSLNTVFNANYDFVEEQSILDVFNEPLIRKTYDRSYGQKRQPNMDSDFGYLGKIQSFGFNVQYDQSLVPELYQKQLDIVAENSITYTRYTMSGDIKILRILDQAGEIVTELYA